MNFDINRIRADFPILHEKMRGGKSLVYFDNAASAQKPQSVIDAVCRFYSHDYANIHRGAYQLSERSTSEYENARAKVSKFFGAPENYCTVFTSGATESLNLVAQSWGWNNLKDGDEILLSEMEHHANIVPWQIAAQHTGAKVVTAKIRHDGSLDMDDFEKKLSSKTKIVSLAHASNVLGCVIDAAKVSKLTKAAGALLSLDCAQSAPHFLDDISQTGADFVSVSSHKIFGPTGSGALIAKREILDSMPPYRGGGDMIESVSWLGTTYRPAPERFEAGTPNITGAIGFGAAIDYIESLDRKAAEAHEKELLARLSDAMQSIKGLRVFGTAPNKVPVVSFSIDGIHPNDIAVMLDASGIAIRTGHHCAEPLMNTLGLQGTSRASLAFYNTIEEVDYFTKTLDHAVSILR